jgi:N-lysine methyltransferase SETD6
VPRTLVLSKTNSELASKIPDAFADLGPWYSLILIIIYEYLRRDTSSWFPYLQLLPTTFDTLMFWTPDELAQLHGSAVVNKVGKESAEENWANTILPIMLSHEQLFPLPASNPSDRRRRLLELAHMAGSMIMAYAFDIGEDDSGKSGQDADVDGESDLTEDDEENPAKGMVPFADMLNADANRNNARLFHENDLLIMKAAQDIKAGEEIFNDYGPLPRSDLLRMYGYITDNYYAFDVVEISVDVLENVAASSGTSRSYLTKKVGLCDKDSEKILTGSQREELESLGFIDDAVLIGRPEPGLKLQEILPTDLRMLVTAFCQPNERFNPSKLSNHIKESGLAISEASLILTSITNRLSDYKTSLQEDAEILEGLAKGENLQVPEGLSHNRYGMAVKVRRGEKEILHEVLQLTQNFVAEQTRHIAGDSAKRKRNECETATSNKKPMRK